MVYQTSELEHLKSRKKDVLGSKLQGLLEVGGRLREEQDDRQHANFAWQSQGEIWGDRLSILTQGTRCAFSWLWEKHTEFFRGLRGVLGKWEVHKGCALVVNGSLLFTWLKSFCLGQCPQHWHFHLGGGGLDWTVGSIAPFHPRPSQCLNVSASVTGQALLTNTMTCTFELENRTVLSVLSLPLNPLVCRM